MSAAWPWVALAGLGAFHGLNPAMGWLFAVALGLQRRSRSALLGSLVPIAAGHALSVLMVVVALGALRAFIEFQVLEIGAAAALIGFGVYRLLARHRGRAGMRVGSAQLLVWSFLMATAHGAGLMLAPVLLGMPMSGEHAGHVEMANIASLRSSAGVALTAVGIHTAAMLATAGAIALVVYEWLGLAFLRRGWINLDLVWVLVLIGAGVVLLCMALAGG